MADLERGTYELEFTATDKAGLTDKDTVAVSIYDPRTPGANELIFKNLEWKGGGLETCAYVGIENFNLYIPDGTAINVFVKKRRDAAVWMNVRERFGSAYAVRDNSFWLSACSESYGPDIKVTF